MPFTNTYLCVYIYRHMYTQQTNQQVIHYFGTSTKSQPKLQVQMVSGQPFISYKQLQFVTLTIYTSSKYQQEVL